MQPGIKSNRLRCYCVTPQCLVRSEVNIPTIVDNARVLRTSNVVMRPLQGGKQTQISKRQMAGMRDKPALYSGCANVRFNPDCCHGGYVGLAPNPAIDAIGFEVAQRHIKIGRIACFEPNPYHLSIAPRGSSAA